MRVVSYNVLADSYIRRDYYPLTPEAVLDPERRRKAVVERVAGLGADVVCLQEVERPTFEAVAARLGGDWRFLKKQGGKPDGCAIFLKGRADEWREMAYPDGTGHVALGAVTAGIGIATTHLKWDPNGALAEFQLAALVKAWVADGEKWIVCGDFNGEPGSGALEYARLRGLRDAYAGMPDAFTCNANRNARRIDFLLHTPGLRAEPRALVPIDAETPLPSEREPSDHLPIAAEISLTL